MKNIPLLIGSLVLTLVAVVAVSVMFTKKATAPIKPVEARLLLSDTPHVKGKQDAKVTIVEFSDLQCPACRAIEPTVQQLVAKNSENIRFVYRHFPLRSIHEHALEAARASEAAQRQNAFWEFHDKLFETQDEWAGEKDPTQKFLDYAKELKLNVERFKKDYSDKTIEDRILADERDGNSIGISVTPTFFVNGMPVAEPSMLAETVTAALEK